MSCDADNHISTKEITEQEVNHKTTYITSEASHSSQSQVTIEADAKPDVFKNDNFVTISEGEADSPVNEDTYVHDVSPVGDVILMKEHHMRKNSKETQTEIIVNQSNAEHVSQHDEQSQIETTSTISNGLENNSDSGEVLTNGEDITSLMSNGASIDKLKLTQDGRTVVRETQTTLLQSNNKGTDLIQTASDFDQQNGSYKDHPSDNQETSTMYSCNENITTENIIKQCTAERLSTESIIDIDRLINSDTNISSKENTSMHLNDKSNGTDRDANTPITVLKEENGHLLQPAKEIMDDREYIPKSTNPELTTDSSKSKENQVAHMNGLHSLEIKEENLKTQLKEIIDEIDLEVKKEEEGDYAYYHTWQPKGEYKIEKTHIEYQEIVPVKVADILEEEKVQNVKELPKKQDKKPQLKPSHAKIEKPKVIERKPSEESSCTTPIEIPEGVPLLVRMLPPKEGENDEGRDKIPLERIFTPASDLNELELKKRKMYSSSSFYRPDHPTIEDQVHLAHKISVSLVDDINKQSKGQSMYMKRKSKSTTWAHTGQESGYIEGLWQPDEDDLLPPKESKEPPPLKLLLNPKGIHDYNSIEDDQYEEYATVSHSQHQLSSIGVGKEIVTDLQSPTGKGAALFARRKKRMDKFIIDETNVQKSFVNKVERVAVVNENVSSAANSFCAAPTVNNTPSKSGSRNLPDLSNILTQSKPAVAKSILSSKEKSIKRSNTVSFSSLDRGFPHRTPTPSTRERRGQIKSWGSQKDAGISVGIAVGGRPQAQKRFSHIELSSTANYYSPDGRPLDFGKKQKTNTMYTAEVKVEEKSAVSPAIIFDVNGIDSSQYLDLAMDSHDKKNSFNLAAKGWGTYNNFYTPLHLGTAS